MRTAGRTAARACSTGAMLLQRVLAHAETSRLGGCEEAAAGCSARIQEAASHPPTGEQLEGGRGESRQQVH
jgi:hypothetical protein